MSQRRVSVKLGEGHPGNAKTASLSFRLLGAILPSGGPRAHVPRVRLRPLLPTRPPIPSIGARCHVPIFPLSLYAIHFPLVYQLFQVRIMKPHAHTLHKSVQPSQNVPSSSNHRPGILSSSYLVVVRGEAAQRVSPHISSLSFSCGREASRSQRAGRA